MKKVSGGECAVGEKVIWSTVERVGSRMCNSIDHASGSLSIFRRVVTRENGDLLDGVYAHVSSQNAAGRPIGIIVQADAIKTIVVLLRARAGDGKLLTEPAIAAIRAAREAWLSLNGCNAGLQG